MVLRGIGIHSFQRVDGTITSGSVTCARNLASTHSVPGPEHFSPIFVFMGGTASVPSDYLCSLNKEKVGRRRGRIGVEGSDAM